MPSDTSSQRPLSSQLTFEQLVQARIDLQEMVVGHRDSVNYFATSEGFARTAADLTEGLQPEEVPEVSELPPTSKLSGLTTSLTCFESLYEYHESTGAADDDSARVFDRQRMSDFTRTALSRPDDWRSEGAARKYCIVRSAAPMLTNIGKALTKEESDVLVGLLKKAWWSVGAEVDTQGLYETAWTPSKRDSERKQANPGDLPSVPAEPRDADDTDSPDYSTADPAKRYPPNTFLTYWALRGATALPDGSFEYEYQNRFAVAYGWMLSTIGRQVALHLEGSALADPQQLAWAICGVIVGDDKRLAERSGEVLEIVRAGIRVFFEQQRPSGSWGRGQPLFHYPEAGNAYCYQYETLGELLSLALEPRVAASEDLRRLLRPYIPQLLKAMEHADETGVTLPNGGIGWNSGHHPHRRSPESWATAAIYKFLQALRRLVGLEVRRQAARSLGARKPRENLTTLRDRGDTWNAGQGSAGELLATLFVHPVLQRQAESRDRLDPDQEILVDKMARSSILFGPPGTGKTTLAEAVAGALDWDFIEITPAQFLNDGTALVSARADAVFRQLMEMDRCVVLLDEIDELVRDRTAGASGPTERFFTTTMLPRLSALWKQRRVIFFANTNGIDDVDHAIRRSQRFDAAIHVMPPSVRAKRELMKRSPALQALVDDEAIKMALSADADGLARLGGRALHAWLPFIRYDQTQRLIAANPTTDNEYLGLLLEFGKELTRTDWHLKVEPDLDQVTLFRTVREAIFKDAGNARVDESAPRWNRLVTVGADERRIPGHEAYERFSSAGQVNSAGERIVQAQTVPSTSTPSAPADSGTV